MESFPEDGSRRPHQNVGTYIPDYHDLNIKGEKGKVIPALN
jgi:hypothetical protein